MKVSIAIDSFKGCLTSSEAGLAASEAFADTDEVECFRISDGGEGFAESLASSLGGHRILQKVRGPLGEEITASFVITDDGGTAIMETAEASGLCLVKPENRDIFHSSSGGTGELMAAAISRNVRKIFLGLGGSATNDGGVGLLEALGYRFGKDGNNDVVSICIPDLEMERKLKNVDFECFYDTSIPFFGPEGATYTYAVQKGCPDSMLGKLDNWMEKICNAYSAYSGKDILNAPGSGAAGGIGGAMYGILGAKMRNGIESILDIIGFADSLDGCGLVITGEGKADSQTLTGKAPKGVLDFVRKNRNGDKAKVLLIAGRVEDRADLLQAGFDDILQVTPPNMPYYEAMEKDIAKRNITETLKNYLKYGRTSSSRPRK